MNMVIIAKEKAVERNQKNKYHKIDRICELQQILSIYFFVMYSGPNVYCWNELNRMTYNIKYAI